MPRLPAPAPPALPAMSHPCLTCGACCTQYRVAFHWLESDEASEGGVPAALTERLDAHRLCMRGTHSAPIRCIALDAEIGVRSRCGIHANRPSVCREVEASWEFGRPSSQCDRARVAHGLAPLSPADWLDATHTIAVAADAGASAPEREVPLYLIDAATPDDVRC